MLIRVQAPKNKQADLIRIRIDFTLSCRQSPGWVSDEPSIQKFRVLREKACDAELAGSMVRIRSRIYRCLSGSILPARNMTKFQRNCVGAAFRRPAKAELSGVMTALRQRCHAVNYVSYLMVGARRQ